MPITAEGSTFRLDTAGTSYWFRTTSFGHLEHLYYGPRLDVQPVDAVAFKRSIQIGATVAYDQSDLTYSLDALPLEWSGTGYGDYRYSPIEARLPDGGFASDFTYVSHEIVPGDTPMLDGLPSSYGTDDQCSTLRVDLVDAATAVRLQLFYTVYDAVDVITRRAVLINASGDDDPEYAAQSTGTAAGPLTIRRLLSGSVDLPDRNFRMVTFDGDWIKEAHRHDHPLAAGLVANSSTTGASSNRHNPGFLLAEGGADEDNGWVYGFNLVYSGNHLGLAEVGSHDLVRVALGVNPHCFEWTLQPGERFETPEMVMTFSDAGMNGASHHFHDFVNDHIVRGDWQHRERPVLFNNWEAHFFDFTEKKLLQLARGARDLGVELFVLDDGWFGQRDSDTAGLGDYDVNRRKLPSGLTGFADEIRAMGMEFGLWFEPEMVNEDSDLFRAHPEWAVRAPGRRTTLGRNQLVLDLTNPDVQDYIIESVGSVLDSAGISYVKWDMNRHISDAYSPTLSEQGRFFHSYILGLYRVLDAIFRPRPQILLESCASGGDRFDLGMLCYSPQVWTSDDTDPIERLAIQGGLSYLYPPSCMGAHVSQAPHQQTLRLTPLSTRFNVAAFGVLGYELDLKYLTGLQKKEIREQIAFYKEHRRTFQYGRFSRFDPRKANKIGWQTVARDGSEAVSGFFQTLATANEGYDTLRVTGLDPARRYTVTTRPQYLYLDRFGELLKHILPVTLDPNGPVIRTAGKVYHLTDCVETYQATGALLAAGVMLDNQFMGSGYNEHTRLLGDFGSALYVTTADLTEPPPTGFIRPGRRRKS